MTDSNCVVSAMEPRTTYVTPELIIGRNGDEFIRYSWQGAEVCVIIQSTVKECGLSFYKAVAISQTNKVYGFSSPRVPHSLTGVATYARAVER